MSPKSGRRGCIQSVFPTRETPREVTGLQQEIDGFPLQDCSFPAVDGVNCHGLLFAIPSCQSRESSLVTANRETSRSRQKPVMMMLQSWCSVLITINRAWVAGMAHKTSAASAEDGTQLSTISSRQNAYAPALRLFNGSRWETCSHCRESRHSALRGMVLQSGFASLRKIAATRFP